MMNANRCPRQPPRALQAADVGAGDTAGDQLGRQHPPPVRLDELVADGRHEVRQRPRLQPESGVVGDYPVCEHRMLP
jgi:hypothetical protein